MKLKNYKNKLIKLKKENEENKFKKLEDSLNKYINLNLVMMVRVVVQKLK
jgi:hypothetical protein